mmetsp:Transcript_104434/g.185708  ORF Transcript_104434/g.185708 Transcript_104434/m.185708 type:complete len:395 (-) Transcript_104434:344-1528(-)|eukprot:CAMPEP_0197665058 /NCGR_PEP_ID=MMETSP1338-20131121/59007_1 /TAXON_ID=43686 ORGANISM="Pelagodinium beii, Strain RCC1491" /NCGR_SAMPLE_ID=MMETSP1338 /ASSEMBLY_ACC=CAM_ASM_000754 /LENGTH=394 /DNA_ID=CAMNT_0043243811 /DNA_START=60 /DNA_END=1244 /DNA_ORIENTATION=+
MPMKFRQRPYPKWAQLALRNALAKAAERRAVEADVEAASSQLPRQFFREAVHGMADADAEEKEPLGSSRDLVNGEEANEGSEPEEKTYTTYREMMDFANSDKKSNNFLPILGNIYRYWGLGLGGLFNRDKGKNFFNHVTMEVGLLLVFIIQLLAPAACIIYAVYDIDWKHFEVGLDSWTYVYHSRRHGISNLLKHFVAVLFLFCFALNGSNVIYNEKIASMKLTAMLRHSPDTFTKDVQWFWMFFGPIMNCVLVIECCIIVYLLFLVAESPMDVVQNALAVTFLYNLDDIGGDMGFLQDEHWDSEAVGKEYYEIATVTFEENEDIDPDQLHEHTASAEYTPLAYKFAMPIMYLLTAGLPIAYICISGLEAKPSFVDVDILALQNQVAELQKQIH